MKFISFIITKLLIIIPIILCILITVAFYTLAERKVMASIQRRLGPNVAHKWGTLQPLADALKLILKEIVIPHQSYTLLFLMAPVITLFLSLLGWSIIPFNNTEVFSNINLSVLFLLAISSLGVFGIILAGWSSNSRYSFIGTLRAIAQMVSYEIPLGICALIVISIASSINFIDIVNVQNKSTWFFIALIPIFFIFYISIVAETNRTPFDLAEAEAEIVAGYNVEYSSIIFAQFFLGEYCSMTLMSAFTVLTFFGGWLDFNQIFNLFFFSLLFPLSEFINFATLIFAIKTIFFAYLFILIRANLPRYRFDQLMLLCWKIFIPLSFIYFILIIFLFYITNSFFVFF